MPMNNLAAGNAIANFIGALILITIFLLIIRELVCWYNKTNKRIKLEEERNFLLKKILEELKQKNQ